MEVLIQVAIVEDGTKNLQGASKYKIYTHYNSQMGQIINKKQNLTLCGHCNYFSGIN